MYGFHGSMYQNDRESLHNYLNRTPAAWRQSGKSRLDSLLEYVPNRQKNWDTNPWQKGHTLQIFSLGGAESLDRERIAIVGRKGFTSYVAGNREIMTDSQSLVCEGSSTIQIKKFDAPASSEFPEEDEVADENEDGEDAAAPEAPKKPGSTLPDLSNKPEGNLLGRTEKTLPDPHAGLDWGRDELHVEGDAVIRFNSRTFMVKGTFERAWRGGVVRLASMEGVIAGGFYTRAIGGPSLALSGIMTSDVYGGAVKVSACRLLMAGIHYRAAKAAAWACGVYIRRVPFTIEPTHQAAQAPIRQGMWGKLDRLWAASKKAIKIARYVFPVADIAWGLGNILAIPIAMIISKIRKKPIVDPEATGKPRIHVRAGTNLSSINTAVFS